MDDLIIEIKFSTDYGMFKFIEGNREIEDMNVDGLVRSIKQEGNFTDDFPILVNRSMEIIDGQHRFHALKRLGLPIPYRVSERNYTVKNIKAINQNQNQWNILAFLKAGANIGNENFTRLLADHLTHGIGVSTMFQLTRKSTALYSIKDGSLNYPPEESARFNEFMKNLEIFKSYPFYKDFRFVKAVGLIRTKKTVKGEDFSFAVMQSQIKKYGDKLTKKGNWFSWYVALTQLYAHRRPPEDHILLSQDDFEKLTKS